MADRSHVVTVTTTATALNTLATTGRDDSIEGSSAVIYNDGAVTVYVGGADVATSGATKGVPLVAAASIEIVGSTSDILYGRVASGTCDVIVLEVGVAAP